MDADLLTEGDDTIELKGSSIIAAIKASGVEFILSVPDIVTSGGLLRPISRDPAFKLIRVCKEDECIGIASGLSYCDKRALTLIQYTGFLDSINAIRGVAVEYRQPICMMIGLLGHDPSTTPRNSPRYGVRIIEPILDAMGIAHHLINEDADVATIRPAIEPVDRRAVGRNHDLAGHVPRQDLKALVSFHHDVLFSVRPRESLSVRPRESGDPGAARCGPGFPLSRE